MMITLGGGPSLFYETDLADFSFFIIIRRSLHYMTDEIGVPHVL